MVDDDKDSSDENDQNDSDNGDNDEGNADDGHRCWESQAKAAAWPVILRTSHMCFRRQSSSL